MLSTWRSFFFLALSLRLVLPVCGQGDSAIPADGGGLSVESKQRLHTFLQSSVDDGLVPGGIVILVQGGETVFRQSFGYRDLRKKLPFELSTPFRAASLSKSILSSLVVAMASEGLLDLDQPIDEVLVDARKLVQRGPPTVQRAPTLRECLHHTAGFIADGQPGGRPWVRFRGQNLTLAEAVEIELTYPLASRPGTKFAYSGIGYDIAGRIIEIKTGQWLDEVLQERLCGPLGMTDTTFHADDEMRRSMAGFYWRWRSDGSMRRQLDSRIVPRGHYASVGGGLVTTADDLVAFMRMHRDQGIVDGEVWIKPEALIQQSIRKRPGAFYGLGFTLGPPLHDDPRGEVASWILHTGSSGTMFWFDRVTDTIGVVVTQHRYSDGEKMPESEKRIAKDAESWTKTLKADIIDPVLGWRTSRENVRAVP